MNIKDIVKKYGGNMEILSEAMEEYVPKEELNKLAKKVYESTQGKHFDEEFAKEQISKMYYEEVKRIDIRHLNNICKAFNCEISELLEYIPDKQKKN